MVGVITALGAVIIHSLFPDQRTNRKDRPARDSDPIQQICTYKSPTTEAAEELEVSRENREFMNFIDLLPT